MSDDFKYQVNIKVPMDPSDNYRDVLVNVRADSEEELKHRLGFLEENVVDLGNTLKAVYAAGNVAASFGGSQVVGQQAAPPAPAPQDPWAQPQGQAPAWGQQGSQQGYQQPPQQQGGYQQAPQGGQPQPPGPAPMCPHGQMQWRTAKPGSGKDWKGWFCPAPRNDPNKCKNQYV